MRSDLAIHAISFWLIILALSHTCTYSHEQIGLLMINSVASYMYSGISVAKNVWKMIWVQKESWNLFNWLWVSMLSLTTHTNKSWWALKIKNAPAYCMKVWNISKIANEKGSCNSLNSFWLCIIALGHSYLKSFIVECISLLHQEINIAKNV